MEGYKTEDRRLLGIFKDSREGWKEKSLLKQKKIKFLEIKVRDTAQSRDKWKQRAKDSRKELAQKEAIIKEQEEILRRKEALLQAKEAEIELLKKNLSQLEMKLT